MNLHDVVFLVSFLPCAEKSFYKIHASVMVCQQIICKLTEAVAEIICMRQADKTSLHQLSSYLSQTDA